jgi:hypothetical protein
MRAEHTSEAGALAAFLLAVLAGPASAVAQPPTASAPAEDTAEREAPPSGHRVVAFLGFAHWFGPTFGSPEGFTTPVAGVGVQPGLPFLEVRLRYTIAAGPVQLPSGADEHVGFLSLEVALTHIMSFGGQSIEIYAAPFGTLVHAAGATGGAGVAIGARWLVDLSDSVALGPFFEGRTVLYVLPGDTGDLFDDPHNDAQLDLGIAVSIL